MYSMSDETFEDLSRQLKGIKVGLTLAIIAAIVTATGAWITTKRDVAELQADVKEIQTDRAEVQRDWGVWRSGVDKRLERIEANLEFLVRQVQK